LPYRPEDQLRQRIKVVYFALTLLFLVSALLLGSFSIPTDVKNQTIHTITTKPVERYEIVLGRFVGCALLLLAEMAALSGISLWYVSRGVLPQAEQETYKARQPLFAEKLTFHNTKGESVGREWEYRKYVSGAGLAPGARQYAIWNFRRLPGSLTGREGTVPVEYTFDIFRTTKGDETVGVLCAFAFAPGQLSVPEIESEVQRWKQKRDAGKEGDATALAAKYGLYVAESVPVSDYHTLELKVPAELFRKLAETQDKLPAEVPAMQVLVSLESVSGPQLLGVAHRDLYVLAGEGWFWLNFLKGSLGLWLGSCLVLGLALACSTYLSGVISLLVTAFLCAAGLFVEFIRSLAMGTSVGGGPFEAFYRLANKQGMVQELDRTASGVNLLLNLDYFYRLYLQLVLKMIPDVTRFDLTAYVANGFDISWGQVLFLDTLLPLLAYLVPCGILAYYLMNSREIANPT
jgi:hypothetical protein